LQQVSRRGKENYIVYPVGKADAEWNAGVAKSEMMKLNGTVTAMHTLPKAPKDVDEEDEERNNSIRQDRHSHFRCKTPLLA
jgi:hypothetical protein